MRILTRTSIILLLTCSWSLIGCASIFTKYKEIILLRYYHIDKKDLHSELSKILDEMGGKRIGDLKRAYEIVLSSTSSFQPDSRKRTAPSSFTIVKFKGLENIQKSFSAYLPPRGKVMKCNDKNIITRGTTLAPLGRGKYTVTIFATSKNTDLIKYDLRKLKNICFQASRESMTSGRIESNLMKLH